MIRARLSHGQCFVRNGQRARARRTGVHIEGEKNIRAACATGVTAGDVQPRGVCGRRPRGAFGRHSQRDGVSSRRRTFDARGESELERIGSGLLNGENQLGRASQSDEEDRFDATPLQKTRTMDERKN